MEWEDFKKHLGLTDKENINIDLVKSNYNNLSHGLLTTLNNLKQKYEMKEESVEVIKIKILEEIETHKDEFEKYGYDIGYDDGYADGLNARKRK